MFSRIHFHCHEVDCPMQNHKKIQIWIQEVITKEKSSLIKLDFVFCDDNHLFKINQKALKHSSLTDVITFQNSKNIDGEIYISLDRIKENAEQRNLSFIEELKRVMIHGVLHMIGYKDKTEEQKKIMRKTETKYLESFVSRET
jgi:probable rRNA maturation factor